MSWIADIFTGGASSVVEGTVKGVGDVLDNLFTSDEERLAAKARQSKIDQRPQEAQWEINKVEAAHRSLFVAGWRPFIGWICGCGLAFAYIINPVYQWKTGLAGPSLPMEHMSQLVYGLLGLGGLRTFEKMKGKAK